MTVALLLLAAVALLASDTHRFSHRAACLAASCLFASLALVAWLLKGWL